MADFSKDPLRDLEQQLAHKKAKPPQLNLPSDNYKKGAKEKPALQFSNFMPIARDLGVFAKCLAMENLTIEFPDGKSPSEMTEIGTFVYLTEWEGLQYADKIAAYHIHVFFKRESTDKKWRLTAALPKESNFRGKGSDQAKEVPLTGTPSEWWNNTGSYRLDCTKELVKRFASAVLKFKADMKMLKGKESKDPEAIMDRVYENENFLGTFDF
jgi:hypothetical protein